MISNPSRTSAKAYLTKQHNARDHRLTIILGEPDSHAKAKEFIAGAIGAFVDREVETRGLDFIDKEEAKRHGERHAMEQLNQYGNQNGNW